MSNRSRFSNISALCKHGGRKTVARSLLYCVIKQAVLLYYRLQQDTFIYLSSYVCKI